MSFSFNGDHYLQVGGTAMGQHQPQIMLTYLWKGLIQKHWQIGPSNP